MTRLRKILLIVAVAILVFGGLAVYLAAPRDGSASRRLRGMGKREIEVALLARSKGNFTDLHTICLNLLFDELNREGLNGGNAQFVLRNYDLKTLQERHGDLPPYEAMLRENPNLVAVFDNTWGSDLQKSLSAIKSKKLPVVSLNADRTAEFGNTVLFLGSQNMVTSKVASFISQALMPEPELPPASPPDQPVPPAPVPALQPILIFLTEEGYGLDPSPGAAGKRYLYESEMAKLQLPIATKITFIEDKFEDAAEQNRVTKEVSEALKRDKAREVVVIINAHKQWGSRLVAKLEDLAGSQPQRTFRVIGHDSIFNQAIHDKVRPETGAEDTLSHFEMILMKAPNPEYSTHTFGLYRSVLEAHHGDFSDYPKEVASIFVRRCAVATELLRYGYQDIDRLHRQAQSDLGAAWESKSQIEKDRYLLTSEVAGLIALAQDNPNTPAPETGAHLELGALGLVHFNRDGEEDGSHYFELHKPGNRPMAHLKQLNSENKLIPALQIGINEFQIRRVDVERGEFDAEFICSTTIHSKLKNTVLSEMEKLRAKEEALDEYSEERSATGDPRGRLVQYPMLSGLLSIPNMRADGSVAQIGQTDRTVDNIEYRVYKVRGTFAADLNTIRYPFDSHRIGVELQAAVPDHLLTLTAQRVESTAFEENQRGWILNWIHGLVDNRVANGNPLALSNDHTVTRQFKEFAIMVGVTRNIFQPMLVIMLPLILLGLAAIGIMYLGEKETMGKSPSELAMGVVLAVVAYSISYADVVPRSGGATHSDLLYLVTTLMCMGNFGAVLVFGEMGNTRTRNDQADRWRFRYALGVTATYALFLLFWSTSSDMWPV